ncbi:hypothetical protein DF026_17140 [Burkholderia stagnalis]|nr:hypothetical protein DF025_17335 [Burkholderia stagnalis]RQR20355.1 hypothetical protein DF026_17140 [Burkholderia stagnalis]
MKWDVSDQSTQIKEQSSRYFETREAAKKAVETYLRTVCEKASMDALGRWREPNPHIASTSKLQWIAPARTGIQTWVGVIEGHKVATIKRQPGNVGSTCTALLDGWIWDMSKVVPNALGIAESVARGFESVPAAKKAIGQAIRVHPNNN